MPLDLAGILLEAGAVSAEQMERALARQRELGGALDTALLELALVPRDQLPSYLSRASGLPPTPAGECEADPRARRAFPARVAERHGLAPLRLEGKELSLLATHPVDLAALDEISFMLSLRLVPHVAPEWQVRALLAKVYGTVLPERFATLAEAEGTPPGAAAEPPPNRELAEPRPEAAPLQDAPLAAAPVSATSVTTAGQATTPELEPLTSGREAVEPEVIISRWVEPASDGEMVGADDDLDIWIEEDFPIDEGAEGAAAEAPLDEPATPSTPVCEGAVGTAANEEWKSSDPPDAPPRWGRNDALSALEAARSRDEVVTVALRYLRDFFQAAAIFAVTRDGLSGHDAMGWPRAREICRRIRLAPQDAPLLGTALATRAPFLGRVASERGNEDLLARLARHSPRLALAYPVSLRDRPVCIFYADNGGAPVSPRRLGDLLLVLGSLGGALERVLREMKRSRRPQGHRDSSAATTTAAPRPETSSEQEGPEPGSPPLDGAAASRPENLEPAPPAVDPALAVPSPFDAAEAVRRLCLAPAGSDARRLLIAHLVQHGPAAAAMLCEAFPGPLDASADGSDDPAAVEGRGPVLSALHALGPVAAPFLVYLLLDPVPERRRSAALLLGRIGDPAAFLPLAETALGSDEELAAAALSALAGLRRHPDFRPVLERLRRALAVPEADKSPRAAHALGALGDAEAIPLLVQALEVSGPVAEASARALTNLTARQFGRDAAAWISWWKAHRSARRSDWLFESLLDPDPDVRRAAAVALRLAASQEPPLEYRPDASPREREGAARAWRAWWDERRLEA